MLAVGEWSDWLPVDFDLRVPLQSVRGMGRFYLKQMKPYVELYVSPINLDPMSPAMPVSEPDDYAAELATATGRYYTQGMPEDTKGLRTGVLTRDEFLAQARLAGDENRVQYRYVLDRFTNGLLFYYFGNVDQIAHMMWRARDPGHPAYDPAIEPRYADVIEELYVGLDRIVGETLEAIGTDGTLVVLSDHGFTSWRRSFHLNTWLKQEGFLTLANPAREDDPGFFGNVDWSRTRAYGIGLNGLYINVQGREMSGRGRARRSGAGDGRDRRKAPPDDRSGDGPACDHQGLSARAGLHRRGILRPRARSRHRLRQRHARIR